MAKADLTAQQLRDALHYDPETGAFTWSNHAGRKHKSKPAGGFGKHPYRRITIGKDTYLAHRLAWLYMTGNWPNHGLDHIDGNPSNNAFCNLRDVDQSTNSQNVKRPKSNNVSGLLGVSWNRKAKRWVANIKHENKTKWLGYFDSAQEAHECYVSAKRVLHEGNTL
jgi:hypothetical protein